MEISFTIGNALVPSFAGFSLLWVVLFSLLLFGAGILVGRRTPAPAVAGRKKRQGESTGRNASRNGQRTSSSGSVELYVGNLPYETSEKELNAAFAKFGKVTSVRLIESRRDGRPKGFGFVEMEDGSKAAVAIKAMNGKGFKGRSIVVNEARSKDRDDNGSRERSRY